MKIENTHQAIAIKDLFQGDSVVIETNAGGNDRCRVMTYGELRKGEKYFCVVNSVPAGSIAMLADNDTIFHI